MDSSKIKNAIISKIELAIIYELFKNGHINESEYFEIIKKIEKNIVDDNDGENVVVDILM